MTRRTDRTAHRRNLALAAGLIGAALIIAASVADVLEPGRTSLQIGPIPVTMLGLGFVASMLGILVLWLPLHLGNGFALWLREQVAREKVKQTFVTLGVILIAALIHSLAVYLYSLE